MNIKKILFMIFAFANASFLVPLDSDIQETMTKKVKNAATKCYDAIFSKQTAKYLAAFSAGAVVIVAAQEICKTYCCQSDDLDGEETEE
jgi:N-acetylmuramic acid 6-phosphate (MurNAc-6-P) etherase